MYVNKKGIAAISLFAVGLLSSSLSAAPLSLTPLVPGAPVDSFVPRGMNLSQVPGLTVNVSHLSASTEQINVFDTSGTLLFAVIAGGGTMQVLPFGTLADKVNVGYTTDALKSATAAQATGGPVQCPCNARVIYSDGSVEIIAVFDANGNIAYTYAVMKTVQK